MCFFPISITNEQSIQYRSGMRFYDCGKCPECLAKKSRKWALRSYYESIDKPACMITLTYNGLIVERGRIVGEMSPSQLIVDKRDAQLFIKRLRKELYKKGIKIKYLLTAEYGKRTHRPHYHAIIFGYDFPDSIPLRKSKRGNSIYRSPLLTRIWGKGHCTVDCRNISPAVIKYCTKYAVKDSGNDSTFMLFSQGIGRDNLFKYFTGENYIIDGKEYPIPQFVWYDFVRSRVPQFDSSTGEILYSNCYRSIKQYGLKMWSYYNSLRLNYRKVLFELPEYIAYRIKTYNSASLRLYIPILQRLDRLDSKKYGVYKIQAMRAYELISQGYSMANPRGNQEKLLNSFIYRDLRDNEDRDDFTSEYGVIVADCENKLSCAYTTCHISATDTERDALRRVFEYRDSLLSEKVSLNLNFKDIYKYSLYML